MEADRRIGYCAKTLSKPDSLILNLMLHFSWHGILLQFFRTRSKQVNNSASKIRDVVHPAVDFRLEDHRQPSLLTFIT